MTLYDDFVTHNYWGISTSVDAYDCEPKLIRSEDMIKIFVNKLCEDIDMKKFGNCNIIHFGEDEKVAGFSFTQLIETSLISGHFANATNNAYIDIFSCKYYDPSKVSKLVKDFFEAKYVKVNVLERI